MSPRPTLSDRLTNYLVVSQFPTYSPGQLRQLDGSQVPTWVELIDEQITAARDLRRQLLALAGDAPLCQRCGEPMAGRRDRKFCNAACRQAHYRDGRSRNSRG